MIKNRMSIFGAHRAGSDALSARGTAFILVNVGSYLEIAGMCLVGLFAYKSSGAQDVSLYSLPLAALWMIGGGMMLAGSGVLFVGFRGSCADRKAAFWVPLVGNVLTIVLGMSVAEVGLRILAQQESDGIRIGATALVPKDWGSLGRARLADLEQSRADGFFIEDTVLGWTVGPSRRSADGIYQSSVEGLRTQRLGERLASEHDSQRVALFGDSFTFGLNVPFEQSWAHHLAEDLPSGAQVLNFGVDGYGIDQAILRFQREAPAWAPTVTVLSFIQDDLIRAVMVYPFLRGWRYPFSKPRFMLDGGALRLLNVPNLGAERIFNRASIWDLPYLDLDVMFDSHQWSNHFLYNSYLLRYVASKLPRWPTRNFQTQDEAIVALGTRLLEQFVAAARLLESEPLVVYLPSRNDFWGTGPILAELVSSELAERRIEVHDMTTCLEEHVERSQLFLDGDTHYSPAGNTALARCLSPLVALHL